MPTETSQKESLRTACKMGVLDRAILCGLGLSADSANIVMSHIEELRSEIKQLKSDLSDELWDKGG